MGRRIAPELRAQRIDIIVANGWNLDRAARQIGIDPSALRQWMKTNRITRPEPARSGRPGRAA